MGLDQEVADLRAALSHILHHGLPKSETDANAMLADIHANVEEKPADVAAATGAEPAATPATGAPAASTTGPGTDETAGQTPAAEAPAAPESAAPPESGTKGEPA